MGKGSRNRDARGRQRNDRRLGTATDEVFARLLEPLDTASFAALIREHPELVSDGSIEQMRRYSERPEIGAAFVFTVQLLRGARRDPAAAWIAYRRAMDELGALDSELADVVEAIDAALEERRDDDAIAAADKALQRAADAGLNPLVAALLTRRGHAYLQRATGHRSANLEQAIGDWQDALNIVMEPDDASAVLMYLAIAYADRLTDDPDANRSHAIALLREVLALVPEPDPDRRTIIETNLATVVLRHGTADDAAGAREAVELCHSALRHRSPARDADDWAYTQLALAPAMERLAALGDGTLDDARAVYRAVVQHGHLISAPWLVGAAYRGIGRLELAAAWRSPEGMIEAHASGRLADYMDNEAGLRCAAEAFERARPLVCDAPDVTIHGDVLAGLTEVSAELGEHEQALLTGSAALEILRPDTAPKRCSSTASTVAGVLAQSGRWEQAADVYRLAIDAGELALGSRIDSEARARVIRELGTTHRWGAFALARTGAFRDAALTLETGRTRELRRRFQAGAVDRRSLHELPERLRDAYSRAAGDLARAPVGATAGRRYGEVLAAIREVPGFADLGVTVDETDLAAACEPGWPILYINPTPGGTLLLLIAVDDSGDIAPIGRILDEPTAAEVYNRLGTGDPNAKSPRSYLLSAGGAKDSVTDEEFRATLDEILSWVGDALSKPVLALLADAGAQAVTLIVSGPLAAVPLHAASWDEGGDPRCLLDELDVRFAPSAALAATAVRRAREREQQAPTFVGLGDPVGNLPAAQPEVREIARMFTPADARLAVGPDATVAFLHAHAPRAHYLHLACHARGGLFDSAESAVQLADATLSAFELTELPTLSTRLVTISACQSALSEIAGLPDEVISLGTALIAAGSACAIASMWSVDDAATALLMVRLYHEIRFNGRRPPEALRQAQLWLRDLTPDDEGAFLDQYPVLRTEFRRRTDAERPPGRRSLGNPHDLTIARPYAHPDMWAPFVAVGS